MWKRKRVICLDFTCNIGMGRKSLSSSSISNGNNHHKIWIFLRLLHVICVFPSHLPLELL